PSAVSMAETGLVRAALLTGSETSPAEYRRPYQSDFYNMCAMMSRGLFHLITSRHQIPWSDLPANAIQRRGEPETDCYNGVCSRL
ncbi:MAG: hypothetical protein MUC78_06075, partial [Bacteroidales bacterium]|nr:hypothetical protein [Bacteroidales bacterium]